jgi:hypothetical protein
MSVNWMAEFNRPVILLIPATLRWSTLSFFQKKGKEKTKKELPSLRSVWTVDTGNSVPDR